MLEKAKDIEAREFAKPYPLARSLPLSQHLTLRNVEIIITSIPLAWGRFVLV